MGVDDDCVNDVMLCEGLRCFMWTRGFDVISRDRIDSRDGY